MVGVNQDVKRYSLGVFVDHDYCHTDYYTVVATSLEQAMKLLEKHRGKCKLRSVYAASYSGQDPVGTIVCTNW